MRAAKHLLTIGLVFIWLWPSLSVWGLGLHLALDHSGLMHAQDSPCHSHAELDDPHAHDSHSHDHDGGCHQDLALTLADVADHGHSHDDETEAADHSHDVTLFASKLLVNPSPQLATMPVACLADFTARPVTSVSEAAFRRGPPPPLFTANCSLLL